MVLRSGLLEPTLLSTTQTLRTARPSISTLARSLKDRRDHVTSLSYYRQTSTHNECGGDGRCPCLFCRSFWDDRHPREAKYCNHDGHDNGHRGGSWGQHRQKYSNHYCEKQGFG